MKDSSKILLLALISAAGVWIVDAVIDWLVFYRPESLLDLLFFEVPAHEVYIRSMFMLAMLVFGWISGRIIERRHAAEAELEKSENLLSSIIDQSPFPTWIADSNGINIRQNAAYRNLLELDDDQRTVGRYNLFEDNLLAEQGHLEKLERVFLRGEPVAFVSDYDTRRVEQLCMPDGPRRLLQTTVFPISDSRGKVINAVFQCEDITEKRKVDEAIRESEERFRAMFDISRDVMAIVDMDDRLRWTNLAWCDVFGFRVGAHVDWFEKLHPEDQERFTMLWHNVKNGIGEITNLEMRFKSSSGRYIYMEVTVRPIEVDRREMLFFDGYDVTLRKRAENRLAEEKERLGVTLQSIGDGVIAVNAAGKVVLINSIACELTGRSQADGAGKPLAEVLPLYLENVDTPLADPLNHIPGEPHDPMTPTPSFTISSPTGKRTVELSQSILTNRTGEHQGVVIVIRDVTGARKMEEELQRADKLESLGVLAGGIAHDFNNILTSILGNIELSRIHAEGSSSLEDSLSRAKSSALSAKELTGRLLTFSKGGAPLKRKQDVAPFIGDAVRLALSGSNVSLEEDIADGLWQVEVDIEQFGQVIRNLVVNAVQAMPEGGKLRVEARNLATRDKQLPQHPVPCVMISVNDNGPGIAKDELTKIFDPFYTTREKGSGLGLSVSYSIIQRHGGVIDAQSVPDDGTTFRVFLPAFPPEQSLAQVGDETTQSSIEQLRVLVLDDEAPVRVVAEAMIHQLGHRCSTVPDGKQAVELYRRAMKEDDPFDLVILDLTVPGGMGGLETLSALKEIDADVRSVVSSGYSDNRAISDFEGHGFEGALAKPYELNQLDALLNKLFGTVGNS